MSDLKSQRPRTYNEIIQMMGIGPHDWRCLQVHTSARWNACKDARDFLQTWETTGEDTIERFIQISCMEKRFDIINKLEGIELPPNVGELESSLFMKIVWLLCESTTTTTAATPNDWRAFKKMTIVADDPSRDAIEFLNSWHTTTEDTINNFLRLAIDLGRRDIVGVLGRKFLLPETFFNQLTKGTTQSNSAPLTAMTTVEHQGIPIHTLNDRFSNTSIGGERRRWISFNKARALVFCDSLFAHTQQNSVGRGEDSAHCSSDEHQEAPSKCT